MIINDLQVINVVSLSADHQGPVVVEDVQVFTNRQPVTNLVVYKSSYEQVFRRIITFNMASFLGLMEFILFVVHKACIYSWRTFTRRS